MALTHSTANSTVDSTVDSTTDSAVPAIRLDHPVIDGDAHLVEYVPLFLQYLKDVGGAKIAERFAEDRRKGGWYALSSQERLDKRVPRPSWWALPAENTLDRATAMLPNLLRARMDEMGLDFSVIYSTMGIRLPAHDDQEMRLAAAVGRGGDHVVLRKTQRVPGLVLEPADVFFKLSAQSRDGALGWPIRRQRPWCSWRRWRLARWRKWWRWQVGLTSSRRRYPGSARRLRRAQSSGILIQPCFMA